MLCFCGVDAIFAGWAVSAGNPLRSLPIVASERVDEAMRVEDAERVFSR